MNIGHVEAERAVNVHRVAKLEDMLAQCDVITVNCPLHEGTRGLINKETLKHVKKGAWIVNTARGAICDQAAIKEALESGHINGESSCYFVSPKYSLIVKIGYGGDVWNVQPSPRDHPWRTVKNPLGGGNAMVAHYSGTTLDAQARYASGTKDILDRWLHGKEQDPQNVIVADGDYTTKACELFPALLPLLLM